MIPLVDLRIQYQEIQEEIQSALERVLVGSAYVKGPEVYEFEQRFAEYCGAGFAVGTSSGTTAIQLALAALDIGAGDEVILPSHTFFACVEPILQLGAQPVFADVHAETGLIDAESIATLLTGRTRAILPVHLYGQMADMDAILSLARGGERAIAVIEDCSQAAGARQGHHRAGSRGDFGCFSFYPGKNLGAYGDAGAVTARDRKTAEKMAKLADHGRAAKSKYRHDLVGFNYRLDTLQAAVLLVKLRHLDAWNHLRISRAELYHSLLSDVRHVRVPTVAPGNKHVYHLYVMQTEFREGLRAHLGSFDIGCGVHYPIPIHVQPAMMGIPYRRGALTQTEWIADRILSLPMYPELTDDQVVAIVQAVESFQPAKPSAATTPAPSSARSSLPLTPSP